SLERADDDAVGLRRHPHELLRRDLQRRVLQQDRAFERLQGSTGIQPELAVQELSRLAVDLERVRLPACAIEGEHQLTAQPLSQGMSGDKRLELAHQLGVAAQSQVRLDSLLERRDTQFLEPRDLVLSERVHGEVGQWRTAPQSECFEQRATRQPRTTGTECTSALLEEPL